MILSKAILVELVDRMNKAEDCRTCFVNSNYEVCMACGRLICKECDKAGSCGNSLCLFGCAE